MTVASTCWIVNEWPNGDAVEGGSRDVIRALSGVSLRGTEQNRRNQSIFNIAAKDNRGLYQVRAEVLALNQPDAL